MENFSYFYWISNTIGQLDVLGHTSEALIQAQHFATCYPDMVQAEAAVVELLVRCGKGKEAHDLLGRVKKQHPHSSSLYATEVAMLFARENEEVAHAVWKEAIEVFGPSPLLVPTITRLLRLGDFSFSFSILESCKGFDGRAEQERLSLIALLHASMGDGEQANEILNGIGRSIWSPPPVYYVARAQTFLVNDLPLDGEKLFNIALENLTSLEFDLYLFTKRSLIGIARTYGAKKNREAQSSLEGDAWNYRKEILATIVSLTEKGLYAQALFQCGRLKAHFPKSGEEALLAARLSYELRVPQETLRLLASAPSDSTQEAELANLQGSCLIELGRYEEFVNFLTTPRAQSFLTDLRLLSLLESLICAKEFPLAFKMVGMPIEKSKDPFTFLAHLMRILEGMGYSELAQQSIKTTPIDSRSDAYIKILMTEIEKQLPNAEKIKTIIAAVRGEAYNKTLHYYATSALSFMGESEAALKFLGTSERPLAVEEVKVVTRRDKKFHPQVNEKLVVFVTSAYRPRFAKMARALSKVGWTAMLVTTDLDCHPPANCFQEIHKISDMARALAITASYRPKVCHLGSWLGDPLALLLLREKICKTVIDSTEYCLGLMPDPACAEEQLYQAESFRLADGLCARDLRPQLMYTNYKIPKPSHVLYFPDYCWDDPEFSLYQSTREEGVHAVSVVGRIIDHNALKNDLSFLIQDFSKNRIHLHLYPASCALQRECTAEEDKLLDEIGEGEYVHIHKKIDSSGFIKALSGYDFGVEYYAADPSSPRPLDFTFPGITERGSHLVSDFIDAGLQVCFNANYRHTSFVLRRSGLAVPIDSSFFAQSRFLLEEKRAMKNIEALTNFRKSHSVDRHVHRLTRFYESL